MTDLTIGDNANPNHHQAPGRISVSRGLWALSPVVVFLILYPAVSIAVGDFYRMPVSVALIGASIWAVATFRGHTLHRRIEVFTRAAGHDGIMQMIWIFILAGAFAALARSTGAIDATVALTLKLLPYRLLIPGLFMAACFISLSIGTSVGTVVALTPLAVDLATTGGGNVAMFTATVLGGAFFGDNLSFISDTTIAATRTQGVKMSDKFKANLRIVLPAALLTLTVYVVMGTQVSESIAMPSAPDYWLITPYLLIIVASLAGVNVMLTLTMGIMASFITGIYAGMSPLDIASNIGSGIDSMGELIVVTLLAAGMLGIVKASGGIAYLLQTLTQRINGRRGAKAVIGLLVSAVNLCTANNTVAIITVGSITRDISRRMDVDPRKAASLLDTCSCIVQCLIPYGAQTLLATGMAGISPAAPLPYLVYPVMLALTTVTSIILTKNKSKV